MACSIAATPIVVATTASTFPFTVTTITFACARPLSGPRLFSFPVSAPFQGGCRKNEH